MASHIVTSAATASPACTVATRMNSAMESIVDAAADLVCGCRSRRVRRRVDGSSRHQFGPAGGSPRLGLPTDTFWRDDGAAVGPTSDRSLLHRVEPTLRRHTLERYTSPYHGISFSGTPLHCAITAYGSRAVNRRSASVTPIGEKISDRCERSRFFRDNQAFRTVFPCSCEHLFSPSCVSITGRVPCRFHV